MPLPVALVTAGKVGAVVAPLVSQLLGANKQSKSAKSAANIQAQSGREALAEQRRIYDIESAKEDEQRTYRRNAFGGFADDLSALSKGYAPAYGMTDEQTQGILAKRNDAVRANYRPSPQAPLGPQMPRVTPTGPPVTPGGGPLNSMATTVWLEAPTGEQMEVPMDQAPMMISQGAKMIPGPTTPAGRP